MKTLDTRRNFIGHIGGAAGLSAMAGVLPAPLLSEARGHDPTQAYRAWFFLMDTTTSVTKPQFDAIKRSFSRIVESRVSDNDFVWLAEITGGPNLTADGKQVKGIAMPAIGQRRSERSESQVDDLAAAKKEFESSIQALTQRARLTDMKSPIESALGILGDQTAASGRILVIGSDFVTDEPGKGPSPLAPSPSSGVSAARDQVLLIVAEPGEDDSRKLALSPAQHYAAVVRSWTSYFRALGAVSVSAAHLASIDL